MTPRIAASIRLVVLAVSLRILAVAPAVAGPIYTLTDLGPLIPESINSSGQEVGRSGSRAFLDPSGPGPDAGRVEDLSTLGGLTSSTASIDDAGQVVGESSRGNEVHRIHAFLSSDGQMTDLDPIGSDHGDATDINAERHGDGHPSTTGEEAHPFPYTAEELIDLVSSAPTTPVGAAAIDDRDELVGTAASEAISRGMLSGDGQVTDLSTLAGKQSSASDRTDAGQVAGHSEATDQGVSHTDLSSDATMQDLGTLGSQINQPSGFNAAGQVVGRSDTADRALHAFLSSDGAMHDLNSLVPPATVWTLAVAQGRNDAGQIGGVALRDEDDSSRLSRGFLLTSEVLPAPTPPTFVPESSTLALLVCAAAVAGVRRLGRRGAAQG